MKQSALVAKLQQRQEQIAQELREAKTRLANQREKQMTRSKLILGSALLSIPVEQRDALLPLVMGHMTARDRQFVTECLSDDGSSELRDGSGSNENEPA